MKSTRRLFGIISGVLLSLVVFGIAYALPTFPTIDGRPDDWLDAVCHIDPGGVDDETSPQRADVTEFCTHVDYQYMYMIMGYDDTYFKQNSTVGTRVEVTGDGLYDYIVVATLNDNAVITRFSIGKCSADGVCINQNDVFDCPGTSCLGALAAAGQDWDDPFTHTGSVCEGTNCLTLDAFVEMAIPWELFGFINPEEPFVFGSFGSYPSGPAQAPKDDTGPNGIGCYLDGTCYPSTPTSVELIQLIAYTQPQGILPVVLLAVALLAGAGLFIFVRQKNHFNR
jgi:hypothetical protein